MEALPFVSIVVPTYNRSHFITITLRSIIELEYPNEKYEVIVANNNSTDNTFEIVNQFIAQHPAVNIVQFVEQNQGVHFARNSAAKLAKGEFLYFTDDDMIIDKSAIKELLYLYTLDSKIASVTGVVLPHWEVTPPTWIVKLCNNALLSLNDPQYDLIIANEDCNVFSCHQMIKRDVFFQSGGFNPENTKGIWLGDGETGLNKKIQELGLKFAFNRRSIIHHIIPQQRLTQKYLNKRFYNQGNCDSYTDYREKLFSKRDLVILNLKFAIKMFGCFLIAIGNRLGNNIRWRIRFGYISYFYARIRYNLKLMNDSDFKDLVLRKDWLT